MIAYNFDRIFRARNIEKPFRFLKNNGFSDSFASKVSKNNVIMLHPREMEKLCLMLHCTPNDLLQWTPERGMQVSKDHPLFTIRKTNKVTDMTKTLNSIPIGQLDEIEQMILEKIKPTK